MAEAMMEAITLTVMSFPNPPAPMGMARG
jgi:hypothetical protein